MQHGASADITRVVLSVLVIGVLLVGSLWTLLPFVSSVIWATTIVVATWPALLRLQGLTGGRRGPAAAIMTVLVLLAFIAPLAIAVNTLFQAAETSRGDERLSREGPWPTSGVGREDPVVRRFPGR